MDFLTQLFSSLTTRDSVLVLIFLGVAWLLGYLVKHLQLTARITDLEEKLFSLRIAGTNAQSESLPFDKMTKKAPEPDDLKRLEGIGPKIEELLNAAGIYTWAELSQSTPESLSDILRAAGDRFRIRDPSSWPEQAKLLAEGRFDEFEKLTDSLVAGR